MRFRLISYNEGIPKLCWYEKLIGLQLKRNPVIASYEVRYCEFNIGFNCIYEHLTCPKTLKIYVPFLTKDIQFIRYKEIIPQKFFNVIEKRLDDRIKYIKNEINVAGDHFGLLTTIIQILEEMKYGKSITPDFENSKPHNISSSH